MALDDGWLPPFNTATFANDGNAGENIMMNDTELSGGIALLDEEALDQVPNGDTSCEVRKSRGR